MVTTRTDSHDVVAGLKAGADDYVTKAPRSRIVDGNLEIAPADGMVTRDGEVVPLPRTEFKLLAERGRMLRRGELLE